jgi:toxin ParE1/3/4
MPSRRNVRLSDAAESDLTDILQYTETRWGDEQADLYQAKLERAFVELAEFPMLGRVRSDLPRGYRSRLVEEYVIYYRVEGDTIFVSRIAHERREITTQSLR